MEEIISSLGDKVEKIDSSVKKYVKSKILTQNTQETMKRPYPKVIEMEEGEES